MPKSQATTPLNDKVVLPLSLSVIATHKNNKPALELRGLTTNEDFIKAIVTCAYHGIPIIVMPTFNNKLRALSSLVDKGILYQEEGNYKFTF
jgi:hypothetical protein